MTAVDAAVVAAPAKLNLGLRVVGVRSDGFHLLESVFVPLDLADRLTIEVVPAPVASVRLELGAPAPGLESGAPNLAARAGAAFLAAAGIAAAVRIRLEKRIPVGAGMGGGSSDAGAVLRSLAARFPAALDRAGLGRVALALGADVPFFLDPRPALVGGIGERIEALPDFPSLAVLVVTPAPPLATAEVFAAWDAELGADTVALTPAEGGRRMPPLRALVEQIGKSGRTRDRTRDRSGAARPSSSSSNHPCWEALQTLLTNDLEPVAAGLRPAIARLRAEIARAGARAVGLSGSGPTVFGVFGGADEVRAAAAAIRWEPSDRVHLGRTTGSP